MDQQLKQRLTGAVVLVSLAVIFVPIILEGPRDEWTPRDHTIPEPPGMDYQAPAELPIPAPLPSAAPEQTEDSVAEAPRTVAVPLPPPAAQTAPAKPVKEPPPPPPPSKPTTTAATKQPATPAAGWYVQVGSFGQSDNAGRLRDRLKGAGMDAHLHSADTDKGTSYRVLVGPSATRPQAEKLQQQLATTQKLKGIVIEVGAGQDG